ncbi:MAG: hypothetical protein GC179_28565 [Anaerolineaceae bacterium]|nr:hypothetical protein [Anaerolineaceae bacterium]
MADMQTLFRAVDELSPEERQQLKEYIEQREKTTWWIVPPENLAEIREIMRPVHEDAAKMTEEEINAVIDEALAEVRREEKQRQGRH